MGPWEHSIHDPTNLFLDREELPNTSICYRLHQCFCLLTAWDWSQGTTAPRWGLLDAVRLPRRGSCACRRVSAAACSGCSGGPARRRSSCLALLLHRRGSHHPPATLHSHPAHPIAAVGWNDSSLSVPPAGLGARCAWDGGVSWGKLGGPRHTRGVATLLGTPFFLSPSNCHRVRHLINTPRSEFA